MKLPVLVAVLVLFSATLRAAEKKVIWNFDASLTNSLGGKYNAFSKEPSWARTYLDPSVHLPPSGHSLRITVHREAQGFCGVWLNFYPAAGAPPRYFDARSYRYLTFWVRGAKAGSDFNLKLIDERGERNEDAIPTRALHAYLPRGVTTAWQKVWVPLSDFPEVEPGSLAQLVLFFSVPGDYRFYLDDIAFESLKTPSRIIPQVSAQSVAHTESSRNAMWVWETKNIFENPQEPGRLFAFCSRMGVRRIYLSVEFSPSGGDQTPDALAVPGNFRAFLDSAHRRGLRVEALAGSPEWAVERYHARALAAMNAILAFNRTAPLGARFDGVHFDVEPYVLLGFADLNFRSQLLRDYLEMVSQCLVLAQKSRLSFTCDVPWWFFPTASPQREEMTVDFHGEKKTVGEHLLDLLASVTIMDYRNEADGAGGVISFATPSLAYAAARQKKVVVGLETSAELETPVEFVLAMPMADFRSRLGAAGLLGERTFRGYTLHALVQGGDVFVGLGPPPASAPPPAQPVEQALAQLRETVGGGPNQYCVQPLLGEARVAVAGNPEWMNFDVYQASGAPGSIPVTGFRAIHRTAPTITFHGLGREVFEEEVQSIVEWLGQSPAFGGLAFHYYGSLRALMSSP